MKSKIRSKIEEVNNLKQKALTVFLTSGYPEPENFVELSFGILENGADILEIGIPFGDSLADGPVIQSSYMDSIRNNINIDRTFTFVQAIKKESLSPIVLMGSANPILNYGKNEFVAAALESGVDGVIIPDVPLEEYEDFFGNHFTGLDTILLTTPTSGERIKEIDAKSSGFVYCVSVVGITGERNNFEKYVLDNIESTYSRIKNNKMQIGFGISSGKDIKTFSPFCDGVIVGSAVIRKLSENKKNYSDTLSYVKMLKDACYSD